MVFHFCVHVTRVFRRIKLPSPYNFAATPRKTHHAANRQQSGTRNRCRTGDAAVMGVARGAGHDRHQVRLRDRSVRGLHGAYRWRAGSLVRDAGISGRQKAHHHHRGAFRRHFTRRTESLGNARRSPVRLLPIRADHGCSCAAEQKTPAYRQRY